MLSELAYNAKVTEKCDVYGFGVLILEVITGYHPAELVSSLSYSSLSPSPLSLPSSSSSSSLTQSNIQRMLMKDLLDKRLEDPTPEAAEEIITIMILAFKCIEINPQLRPTMQQVSQKLSTRRQLFCHEFLNVTLGELLNLQLQMEDK